MVDPQSCRFWQSVLRNGLVDPDRLQACWDAIPDAKRTVDAIDRRLARQAFQAGLVTHWQAQQILAGRGQALRIDKYILMNAIGQGGMGRVFLARDTRLHRSVALKILTDDRMKNPRALARFRREATVGAQLQHENLVRIYDEGEAHGLRYLVMEYIEGKTIGQLIAEQGRLSTSATANLSRQVAQGLEHLHQKGLLHRDVNPMNVLVDSDGTAKLTDLGLAIDLGDQADLVTRDGATVGTFDYISPEQARHSRSVDIRSDIYSLGCTMYHMVSGRVPFPMPSLPEKLYAHGMTEAEPLTSLVPGVPDSFDAIIRKMMSKSPEKRYARPSDVVKVLEPFATGPLRLEPISSTPPPTLPEVVAAENGAVPPAAHFGSDPDVPFLAGSEPTTAKSAHTSDPLEFITKIDLGPEPALSESRTIAGGSRERDRRILLWVGAGLALTLVLSVALALRGSGRAADRPPPIATPHDGAPRPGTAVGDESGVAEITVLYEDGQELAETDLREAIRRATGKRAEVILRNTKPLQIEVAKPLEVGGGRLVIRAGKGYQPILEVLLNGQNPWIRTRSDGELSLIGLTFVVDTGDRPKGRPTLIEAAANLTLERCKFTTGDSERTVLVASSDGLNATVTGCFFDGFDQPLLMRLHPGSQTKLSQCIFVRVQPSGTPLGWALSLEQRASANAKITRLLAIDHCTVVGGGLLDAKGFSAKLPLRVQIHDSVLKTSSLLLWSAAKTEFPQALEWKGRRNRYEISGASWVVLPPKGFDGLAPGPTDLKSWSDATTPEEASLSDPLTFVSGPPTEGKSPEELAVVENGEAHPGADPKLVGPPPKARGK